MSKPRKEIDKERMEQLMVGHRKVFVRYNEGAAIYSMGVNTFKEWQKMPVRFIALKVLFL